MNFRSFFLVPPPTEEDMAPEMRCPLGPEANEEASADPIGDPSESQAGKNDDNADDDDGFIDLAGSQEDDDEIDNDGSLIIQWAFNRGREADASVSEMTSQAHSSLLEPGAQRKKQRSVPAPGAAVDKTRCHLRVIM